MVEFITPTAVEGVIPFASVHVADMIQLTQHFQFLRGLMAKGQAENVLITSMTGEPIARLKINIHRTYFSRDFERQQEIRPLVRQSTPHRIRGVVELESGISGEVPVLTLKKSPLHRNLGIPQSALQRLALIAYQKVWELIVQLDPRPQAVVHIENWRGVSMNIGGSVQGIAEIDLPVPAPRRTRIISE